MAIPSLTKIDVSSLIPSASTIGEPNRGGQKIVFPCTIGGMKYVAKFMLAESSYTGQETAEGIDLADEATARASREVETMRQCSTQFLVKLGPIPLTKVIFKGQSIVFFTEEYIEGDDLQNILTRSGPLSMKELVALGHNCVEAMRVLWSFHKIHRDVTPRNIMKRASSGEFVLLDFGLAFDFADVSLTSPGMIPGTPAYLSPERIQYIPKRQIDYRSDFFSLGIVMYQVATGVHPFMAKERMSRDEILAKILTYDPAPPHKLRSELPEDMSFVLMRLLAKKPHQRYRTFELLESSLSAICL